jgi:hypothetical protein
MSSEKQKEYNRQYYLKHKEREIAKSLRRYTERTEWIRNIKSQLCCTKCGENHIACLDFHHRNPKEKEMGIGKMLTRASRKRVLEEMKKCDVLCKNCHAKYHWEENNRCVQIGVTIS